MPVRVIQVIFLIALLFSASCRKPENKTALEKAREERSFFKNAAVEAPGLGSNRMANEPTDFLRSQAVSSIHWQPWNAEVFKEAERVQKLVLVCVGSNSYALSRKMLQLLEQSFAETINARYVPVLADLEIDPALALACHTLAGERKEQIGFPFLIWFSHEGNPVSWFPTKAGGEEEMQRNFLFVESTVDMIWKENPRYVVENSRFDNEFRVKRLSLKLPEGNPDLRFQDFLTTSRLLQGLYDSVHQRFDGMGGPPPGNLITSLARFSQHPACAEGLKKNLAEASNEATDVILRSALRDPLDGAFFARRRNESFTIPELTKHLNTQAELLGTMASVEQTPMVRRAREELFSFLGSKPPLSLQAASDEATALAYFWSQSSLEEALTKEEWNLVKAVFDISRVGNISSGDDPDRQFFRKNSIGLKKLPAEVASGLGLTESEANTLYESACGKLKTKRENVLATSGGLLAETTLPLSNQAHLLHALCLNARANPRDEKSLQAAREQASQLLQKYFREGRLYRTALVENQRPIPAFANDHAALLQALLELHRLTFDADLLKDARLVADHLLEHHLDEEAKLSEYPYKASLLQFPVYDIAMVFGPSTWGMSYGALKKLQSGGYKHEKLEQLLNFQSQLMTTRAKLEPAIHTDFLTSAVNTWKHVTLILPAEPNQALLAQLAGAEFDGVSLVPIADEQSLQGAALLLVEGEEARPLASASEIISALRSALSNLK